MRFFLSTLCIVTVLAASAQATDSVREQQLQEFNQTFERMIANPADRETTVLFSDMAAGLGDFEAAIPPLERLLISNADQPDIKLRIGRYYYELKSFEMAKTYLTEVAQNTTDGESKKESEILLSKLH